MFSTVYVHEGSIRPDGWLRVSVDGQAWVLVKYDAEDWEMKRALSGLEGI